MIFPLLILFYSSITFAQNWWDVPRFETLYEYSYVASSEGRESLDELKERAFISAATIIVREHFGTSVESSESFIEDTGNSKYQFMTKLKSEPMILTGLKLTDIKIFELDNTNRVYVKVSILKSDLIKAIREKKIHSVENIYGVGQGKNYVAIKTNPKHALIQFNGINHKYSAQGHGDAKFFLPKGEYFLTIFEEGHEVIKKELVVLNDNQEYEYNLRPITGELKIRTFPEDAIITPVSAVEGNNPYKLRPNRKYRFRIGHKDYFEQEIEYSISENESYVKEIHLDSRPSTISFVVRPEASILSINNRHYSSGQRISLTENDIDIVIKSPGYEAYEKTIKISPNRDYPVEYITLKKEKKRKPIFKNWNNPFSIKNPFSEKPKKRIEYSPILGLDEETTFAIVPISFFLEWEHFGLGASYNYVTSYKDENDKTTNKELSDFSINARIISPRFDSVQFYLNLTTGNYSVNENIEDFSKGSYEEYQRDYSYYGAGAGIRFYTSEDRSINFEINQMTKNSDIEGRENDQKISIGLGWEF